MSQLGGGGAGTLPSLALREDRMSSPENPPTQSEVLGYFDSLSNWGRWGPDDQLGALN